LQLDKLSVYESYSIDLIVWLLKWLFLLHFINNNAAKFTCTVKAKSVKVALICFQMIMTSPVFFFSDFS